MKTVPVFAIIGHPNEGKSSIVATLAQDDSVPISSTPGETIRLQRFDLKAGNETVIEFIDTPGFQNPQSTLAWFRQHEDLGNRRMERFIEEHQDDPDFHHDCELLRPLQQGAGLLYVVDASRPMTSVDIAEMEILRLTACPRMAIVNAKSGERRFLENWKTAFRQHFNSVRTFNAQRARYLDRMDLLEALKSIDQDWEPALSHAIELVRLDRERATERTAEAIVDYLDQSLRCSCSSFIERESGVPLERRKLETAYKARLEKIERRFREETREIFGINRLSVELPENSILGEDLFSEKTWQALGLTPKQLAVAGALLGAGMGAGADLAAGGITFGVFASLGAAIGAGSALWKGKALARARISQLPLGGLKVTVGPNQSDAFPFIQLDRFLLYARFISNWAHARQETTVRLDPRDAKQGPSSSWNQDELKRVTRFVRAVRKERSEEAEAAGRDLIRLLTRILQEDGGRDPA
jgi:ribosome biogenesis GTPase A